MKKIALILFSLLALFACTEDNTLKDPVFNLSELPADDPAVALPSGGITGVTLKWDEPWSATSTQEWLTISPSEGMAGKHTITLVSERNEDFSAREAELIVQSASATGSLAIRQNPNIYRKTYLGSRKVHWSFSWVYDESSGLARSRLVMPYPETTEYQGVRDRTYSETAKLKTSPEGVNYLLDDRSSSFPASGQPFIWQDFTVDYYDVRVDFSVIEDEDIPYDTASSSYKRYTIQIRDDDDTFMIDPKDSRIVNTSSALWEEAGGKRIEYARLCHKWIIENITYGIYDGPNDINHILERMSGDCGNQHAVWMSLMRAAGIPARPIVMKAPDPDGYSHVRAEFYLPGYGWIPVDPTNEQGSHEDYFGAFKYEPLVVMNRDFGFTGWDASGKFCIGMLQGLSVGVWGRGPFDGKEEFIFTD
mgnify:CR=1 FL=1